MMAVAEPIPSRSNPDSISTESLGDLLQRPSETIKFPIILSFYWSAEDKAFIAEVPELPGCMADGATKAKALAAAERVAREWVETARELGRAVPEPKGRLGYA